MLAQILLVLGFVSIAVGLYLLKMNKRQPTDYIWVGQGEDPFKN